MSALLEVRGLSVRYEAGLTVVHGINLEVHEGEIVALLGANGAGKTTTLLSLGGVLPMQAGEVRYRGAPLKGPLHRRAKAGIGLITEGRSIFTQLSAGTNLALGRGTTERALEMFPELQPLLARRAGLLSGGEQQILSLARMLAGEPRLLLVDELSLGLAPLIVRRLLTELEAAAARGVGIILVEQHARQALRFAHRGYVMRRGRIELEGTGAELLGRLDEIERSYLHGEPSATVG